FLFYTYVPLGFAWRGKVGAPTTHLHIAYLATRRFISPFCTMDSDRGRKGGTAGRPGLTREEGTLSVPSGVLSAPISASAGASLSAFGWRPAGGNPFKQGGMCSSMCTLVEAIIRPPIAQSP